MVIQHQRKKNIYCVSHLLHHKDGVMHLNVFDLYNGLLYFAQPAKCIHPKAFIAKQDVTANVSELDKYVQYPLEFITLMHSIGSC